MLTGAIDTGKRLLMKQTGQSVTSCHLLHGFHNKLVMVYCNICCLINRCQLVLCRCYLIVLCLGSYTKLPQLNIQVFHVCTNSLTDGAEVMILQLLTLRSRCAEKGTSCKDQVFSL